MKTNFMPGRDSDINSFENNFTAKLPDYVTVLGLDPAEIAESIAIINKHRNSFADMISKRAQSKSAQEEHTMQKRIGLKELRRIAAKVRSCKNYTKTIGDDLGIIGPEKTSKEFSEMKPSLRTSINGDEVSVKFYKETSDGVNVYSRRGEEMEFTLLGFTKSSPFRDSRAKLDKSKPEYREYTAMFIKDVLETGLRSDIIKVTVP